MRSLQIRLTLVVLCCATVCGCAHFKKNQEGETFGFQTEKRSWLADRLHLGRNDSGDMEDTAGLIDEKQMPKSRKEAEAKTFESEFAMARLHEKRGEFEAAEKGYRTLLAKAPRDARLHHRLGVLAIKRGELTNAENYLMTARSLDPNNADLLSDLGYCYYLQNRLPEAENTLREALKIKPSHATATNNLGLVVGRQGRTAEALVLFKRVNNEAEAYANLAYVMAQNGDIVSAKQTYLRALTLNNTMRAAAQAMLQLDERAKTLEKLATEESASPRRPTTPSEQPKATTPPLVAASAQVPTTNERQHKQTPVAVAQREESAGWRVKSSNSTSHNQIDNTATVEPTIKSPEPLEHQSERQSGTSSTTEAKQENKAGDKGDKIVLMLPPPPAQQNNLKLGEMASISEQSAGESQPVAQIRTSEAAQVPSTNDSTARHEYADRQNQPIVEELQPVVEKTQVSTSSADVGVATSTDADKNLRLPREARADASVQTLQSLGNEQPLQAEPQNGPAELPQPLPGETEPVQSLPQPAQQPVQMKISDSAAATKTTSQNEVVEAQNRLENALIQATETLDSEPKKATFVVSEQQIATQPAATVETVRQQEVITPGIDMPQPEDVQEQEEIVVESYSQSMNQ